MVWNSTSIHLSKYYSCRERNKRERESLHCIVVCLGGIPVEKLKEAR